MLDCFIVRVSKDVVGRISPCTRKIGCRCVLEESQKAWERASVQVNITCSNRFSMTLCIMMLLNDVKLVCLLIAQAP